MNIFRRRQALAAAQIEEEIPSDAPIGSINGKFTINANGDQVYFSKGNLQYIGSASTPYWQFAKHQWDYLGNNGQGSTNQNVNRDLFGWGTSNWNNGNTYYHPWDSDYSDGTLYGPPGQYNLTGSYANADWGVYNPISNGGNQAGLWRTLTKQEWTYVFNTRVTSSDTRYAKANVNNINGVILLPDNWSTAYYSLSSTNSASANFSSNTITAAQWKTLEQHGAVFLPAAGSRLGTSLQSINSTGYYWSVSYYGSYLVRCVNFFSSGLNISYSGNRSNGYSVRLVQDIQDITE